MFVFAPLVAWALFQCDTRPCSSGCCVCYVVMCTQGKGGGGQEAGSQGQEGGREAEAGGAFLLVCVFYHLHPVTVPAVVAVALGQRYPVLGFSTCPSLRRVLDLTAITARLLAGCFDAGYPQSGGVDDHMGTTSLASIPAT